MSGKCRDRFPMKVSCRNDIYTVRYRFQTYGIRPFWLGTGSCLGAGVRCSTGPIWPTWRNRTGPRGHHSVPPRVRTHRTRAPNSHPSWWRGALRPPHCAPRRAVRAEAVWTTRPTRLYSLLFSPHNPGETGLWIRIPALICVAGSGCRRAKMTHKQWWAKINHLCVKRWFSPQI